MSYKIENFFSKELPLPVKKYEGFVKHNFVGGHNSEENIPVDLLAESAKTVINKEGSNLALYGHNSGPQGNIDLRKFLVTYLKKHVGINASIDNILLTSGSLQAMDLINKLLLNEGDTVLIEEATYGGAISRIKSMKVNHIGIKLDDEGIVIENLIEVLESLKSKNIFPKFLYTIPTVQNPTATILPNERRKKLLQIAEQYNFLIFEDDCYADLTWDRTRPNAIFSMSENDRVIYCGSFSKSIAPALRVGFIVASWNVISQILAFKNDGGSGAIEQMLLADFCKNYYLEHTSKLVKDLQSKCDTMIDSLESEFGSIAEYEYPKGGIFLWITLPDKVNTDKLYELAAHNNITINPGTEWVSNPSDGIHKLRLCFAHPSKQVIREGVKNLAKICYEEFGVPKISGNIKR